MIYRHLFDQKKEPAIVRAGLIGAGDFGAPLITQSRLIPRLEISVIADLNVERGCRAFRDAGLPEDAIVVCQSRARALGGLESGKRVVLQDGLMMMDLPLDVIATATRVPEAGGLYADAAIRHGKHVVMIDKEADSVAGSILKQKADRAGVVFTTDDGDEPGLLMGLVSWARTLGFEVLCGGNFNSCLHDPEKSTLTSRDKEICVPPEDRWALERIPPGNARAYAETRRRLTGAWREDEECGDPVCHMAVSANGAGLLPDTPTGHRPVVRLLELPEVLCPVEDGGILRTRGAVEIPTIVYSATEPDPRNGVFIVVANEDAVSREMMIRKGLVANSLGTAMMLYRPYHLLGAETAMSILCAGLLQVPTGSADVRPRVDIVATAARDFKAGEVLGSPGALGWNRDLRASLIPAFPMSESSPVPFFLLESKVLKVDVPAGALLTMREVEIPSDSVLMSLRCEQDRCFLGLP